MCHKYAPKVYSVLVTVTIQGPWMTPSLNVWTYMHVGSIQKVQRRAHLGGAAWVGSEGCLAGSRATLSTRHNCSSANIIFKNRILWAKAITEGSITQF